LESVGKRIRDEQAVLAQKLDDVTERGREDDILIGEEKGEMKAKIVVAKNSLKAGVSIDVIIQITGLSVDEIKQLQEEIT
jgi:predicted transposase/invertase (TIGR01784 family)